MISALLYAVRAVLRAAMNVVRGQSVRSSTIKESVHISWRPLGSM